MEVEQVASLTADRPDHRAYRERKALWIIRLKRFETVWGIGTIEASEFCAHSSEIVKAAR